MTIKLIAETAWHHQGDTKFLKDLVNRITQKTSTDFIKLHLTLNLHEYMNNDHPAFNELSRCIIDKETWNDVIHICKSGNKGILLLLNDTDAVDFGMAHRPAMVEIHSVCMNDSNLLQAVKNNLTKDIKVVLGVGGSTLYEIENALNCLQCSNIILMFGFQNYPTRYKDVNFNKIRKIMRLYPEFEFGYADHTAWNEPNNLLITLMGAALGVEYIEKHVTTKYGEKRMDYSAAINIEQLNELKNKLHLLEECEGDGNLALNEAEIQYSIVGPMKKAPVFACQINSGDIFTDKMIAFKRTRTTSEISQIEIMQFVGQKLKVSANKGDVVSKKHFTL